MIEKIAVIADIHANKYALDEFLKYINNKNIKCVLNLGDFVQIGPNPYEVSTRIINDKRFINILGNNETSLFEINNRDESDENLHRLWTKEKIYENFEKIKSFPKKNIINKGDFKILMIHSRKNDIKGMPLIYNDNLDAFVKDYEEFNSDIVLFGHTHEKLYIEHNKKIFINPGSLGCSKNGTIDFVVLKIHNDKKLEVDFKALKYDKKELINDYSKNNVPDKKFLLKTFFNYDVK